MHGLPSKPMAPSAFAEKPEWRVLIAACRPERNQEEIGSLLQIPIEWNDLFALAECHGALPLLHEALVPFQSSVGQEMFGRLKSKHQKNLHKAMMLSRELIQIQDALAEAGVEAMPYKGLPLAEMVYGDIALRQTGDIDLLIRPEDVARARDALRTLNYSPHQELPARQEQAYLQSGYEYVFDAPAGRNLLEIQWAIQPRFYAVDLDIDELFERGIAATVAGRATKTPSLEDLFVILSLHAAKHVWGKLIWLSDVARIMQMERVGWMKIGELARRLRIRRILTLNFLLAHQVLGTEIPPGAEEHVLKPGSEHLAKMIEGIISSGVPFDVESLRYFRLMLQLRENVMDRAKFASRLLFTPGPAEWASIGIPDTLFPLYRVVRLSRLAARLSR